MKHMRTKISVIALLIFAFGCKNEQQKSSSGDGYLINGTIVGLDDGVIVSESDSVAIINGRFELEGSVDGATSQYYKINDTNGFSLLLDNEEFDVTVDVGKADKRGHIDEIDTNGSALNDEFNKVKASLENLEESKRLNQLSEKGKALEKDSDAYQQNKEALSLAREAYRQVKSEFIKNYAEKNPNSVIAAYYMQFQANEVDQTFEEYESIVNNFGDEVKKSSFYKPLEKKLISLKKVATGETAPDFTLTTVEGNEFTLSSLHGEKVVLIDFWASWCVPCRKSYPHLKEVYDKYKSSGFEIVGVTNDKNHDSWRKAINEDQLEWVNVADVFPPRTGEPPYTANVLTSYSASYLPSTYLLDKEGKILAKQLTANELDEKLEELFGF